MNNMKWMQMCLFYQYIYIVKKLHECVYFLMVKEIICCKIKYKYKAIGLFLLSS